MILLDGVARSSVVLGAILLFLALPPRKAPVVRHVALAVGLLGVAVMPLLVLLPGWPLPLPPVIGRVEGAVPMLHLPGRSGGATAWTSASGAPDVFVMIMGVWVAGAGVLLGRVVVGAGRLARMRRSAERQGRSIPVGSGVRVVFSSAVAVPSAVGLRRRRVLVPAAALEWSAADRRAVLAHELAHLRRGDAWTLLLASIVRAAYWPNPLIWMAVRRLRAASEEACDDAAIAAGAQPLEYADLLVRLARTVSRNIRAAPVMGIADSATLVPRIRRLVGGGCRRPSRGAVPLTLATLIGLTIGVGTAQRQERTREASDWAHHFGISDRLAERILDAANAEAIEPGIAFGLVSIESGFDPERTSGAGALGLTQILPSSAAVLRPEATAEELRDPQLNLRLGFMLLRRYLDRFGGDTERALLAYNIGPATVEALGKDAGSGYPGQVMTAGGLTWPAH